MHEENPAPRLHAPLPSAEPLTVHFDLRERRLAVNGRLTRSNAHLLQDAVSAMITAGGTSWLIDVAGADLSGTAGLRAVGTAYRRLLRRGCRMTLTGADPALQQRLVRSRLDQHVLSVAGSPGVSATALDH